MPEEMPVPDDPDVVPAPPTEIPGDMPPDVIPPPSAPPGVPVMAPG